MSKITFQFDQGDPVIAYAADGERLLEVAQKSNVAIDAPCSGNASCGKCRVRLISGELESKKTRHISDEEYENGWRLSCVSTVKGDAVIGVPDIASAYQSRMKVADLSSAGEIAIFEHAKEQVKEAGLELKNSMSVVEIRMSEPTLDDTMPDNERLTRAVANATGIERVKIPYSVLKKLPDVLRENDFHVQCIIRTTSRDVFIYDIVPASQKAIVGGLAVDIGTTTVSALIIDMLTGEVLAKASAGNGQIRYGADVINRIIESIKPGGKKRLQDAVIKETMNPMIANMCRAAGITSHQIYRAAIAGNTTMEHLLMGINADPLRMEPYIPAFFKTNSLFAQDIGLAVHPDAHIIVAPNIGSYVGGDITAGTLVSMIWNRPEMSLFIDLGTNGELVFGNSDFMVSCACSAGPAFEGGDISCGMRATDGAIEACTIDPETMEPSYHVIGEDGTKPIGLCGSGIIDVISELFRGKLINPKGKFIREGRRIRHDKYGMGSYVLAFEEEAGSVRDVEITEVDIDNFIRAKGAIFSAIRTMLNYLDMDVSMIEEVYVAGGIGSGINMKNAVTIGMFPDIPLEKFHYIGNSSLTGAYTMLLSTEAEKKTYEMARNMTYLELSTVPTYMDEFVAACFLPHTDTSMFPSAAFDA
ncbi:MAG: corrinoid activation/regeneration protein AcsV [Fusicatenibacter sp.]|nr:corrinoid activation/regeneration protein AcsV [Lachnospiraceae bacterium]MDY2938139.1 corrinoid activation/regeneration protein AcsV [Fusicatenibacter sp.]